jgi:hypothetical protein
MTESDREDDKRRYARFPNHKLSITVARPGIKGIFRPNPSAGCLDFSRTGLQFESDQSMNIGDHLLVDITLDDIELREIATEVISCHETEPGRQCYGAKFCFDHPEMKKDQVFNRLLLIEQKLRDDCGSD